jgi:hypothetical protein
MGVIAILGLVMFLLCVTGISGLLFTDWKADRPRRQRWF